MAVTCSLTSASELQDGRKHVEIFAGQSPPALIAAHRHEDKTEPAHGIGRGFASGVAAEPSIRGAAAPGCTHPAQEGASRQELFCNDHGDFLKVNGVLLTIPSMTDEKR